MGHIRTNKFIGSLRSGIRYGLLALLTFSGAHYFTLYVLGTSHYAPIGALWAMITGTVVISDTEQSTVEKARLQLLGGVMGAVAGFLYLSFLPFSIPGMVIMIVLVVTLCQAIQLSGYTPGAAMNLGVVLVFSSINPELTPLMNSGLRLIEMGLGCGFAILLVRIIPGVTEKLS
ncbi:MAG: FUSC family protein [Methanomicrobiales archaeon]|nr:FUSC family protein [Methanomicrobiales archaeon]